MSELAVARADLKAHMATQEYAYAHAGPHGGAEHPIHWVTRARTAELEGRVADLKAVEAEHSG